MDLSIFTRLLRRRHYTIVRIQGQIPEKQGKLEEAGHEFVIWVLYHDKSKNLLTVFFMEKACVEKTRKDKKREKACVENFTFKRNEISVKLKE